MIYTGNEPKIQIFVHLECRATPIGSVWSRMHCSIVLHIFIAKIHQIHSRKVRWKQIEIIFQSEFPVFDWFRSKKEEQIANLRRVCAKGLPNGGGAAEDEAIQSRAVSQSEIEAVQQQLIERKAVYFVSNECWRMAVGELVYVYTGNQGNVRLCVFD